MAPSPARCQDVVNSGHNPQLSVNRSTCNPLHTFQCQNRTRHQNPTPSLSTLPNCVGWHSEDGIGPTIRFLRMRFGSLSLSIINPVSSLPASRMSKIRCSSPKTRHAIASVPILTPLSPISSRVTVRSETPIRSVKSFTEIRRFNLATFRSSPNDCKARRALRDGILTAI